MGWARPGTLTWERITRLGEVQGMARETAGVVMGSGRGFSTGRTGRQRRVEPQGPVRKMEARGRNTGCGRGSGERVAAERGWQDTSEQRRRKRQGARFGRDLRSPRRYVISSSGHYPAAS